MTPPKWSYEWHRSKQRRDDVVVAALFALLLGLCVVGTLLLAGCSYQKLPIIPGYHWRGNFGDEDLYNSDGKLAASVVCIDSCQVAVFEDGPCFLLLRQYESQSKALEVVSHCYPVLARLP